VKKEGRTLFFKVMKNVEKMTIVRKRSNYLVYETRREKIGPPKRGIH